MNKTEFLEQLERDLMDVSLEERVAALQYFTMYFEDAGSEHEQEVIQELGSPAQVAADIRTSSTESGEAWAPPIAEEKRPIVKILEQEPPTLEVVEVPDTYKEPSRNSSEKNSTTNNNYPYGAAGAYPAPNPAATPPRPSTRGASPLKVLLIVLVCIFFSPVIASLAGTAFGLLLSLISFLAIPLIVGVSLVGSSIAIFVAALALFTVSVGNGLLMLGTSFIVLGLGLLACYLGAWLLGKIIPAIFRGIASLFRKIFR